MSVYKIAIWLILFSLSSSSLNAGPRQDFPTPKNDQISINLAWTHQFQFAGYYAAKELGFFEEQGLDVVLISGTHVNNIEKVLSGEVTYGVSTAGLLVSSPHISELTVLAAIMQQSPVTLLTLKSNGINTLEDLQGKNVVGGTEIRLMLASADLNLSDINFGGLYTDHNNLINGTFDAVSYYITDHSNILGNDSLLFKTFRPIEYGINFYGECLFTSKEEVDNNPERTARVHAATLKGWEYAVNNPDEVIEMILKNYNSGLSREQLKEEAEVTIHSLMQPRFYDIGDMQDSKWNQMADILVSFGYLNEKPNFESFIYNPMQGSEERSRMLLHILLIVLSIAGITFLLLMIYNWQLKKAVTARTKSLEKTNLELDRFVYSVSHDIRSPLSSIQGIINLIRLDPGREEKYLQLIESSIAQLTNFTSEILDYSKNSRTELSIEPVDLNNLIEKSIEELRYLNDNDKVEFITEFHDNGTFQTDAWRLRVILSNLISNAIKYHDPEKDTSFLKITTGSNNGQLQISFEDNGIGIEAKHLDKIYDMFYRATEDSKGSGLGLYIVNETISVLKGEISINSKYGEGTIISLKVPVSANDH